MEFLWKSYGVPMEFLWNNTRATSQEQAWFTGGGRVAAGGAWRAARGGFGSQAASRLSRLRGNYANWAS